MPSRTCGCTRCLAKFPGERKQRRDCVGRWQARYRDANGNQKAKNWDTKKEADAFLDRIRTEVRQRTYHDPKRGEITLEEWWGMWWESRKTRGRPTTRNAKLSAWNAHIRPRWGRRKLISLEYMELQAWLSGLKGHPTQTKVLQLLRAVLRDAVRDGRRIPVNPAEDVEVTAESNARHPDDLKPPTLEQYALIRAALPEYYRSLVDFAQETGMRWGEYIGLRRCHVDLGARTVDVREVVISDNGVLRRQAAPKTAAGFRTVPLTPKAFAALEVMISRWEPALTVSAVGDGMCEDELVFRGMRGGCLDRPTFRRVWVKAIKAAGVGREVVSAESHQKRWWPRVHDYRHALASRLHAARIPEVDVQQVLGQERGGRVTWLYTHGSENAIESVRAALDTGPVLRVVAS